MVELAPQGDGQFAMGFAGDTFNTAWYARRFLPDDWTVSYFTAVGTDAISDQMVSFMAAAGVETGFVTRRRDLTVGLYLISLKGAERSFSYWRSVSAARRLADDPKVLETALSAAKVAYFSGITLAILDEAARGRLLQALLQARQRGTLLVFDPNLRPRLWASDAEMCATIMQFAAVSDIVLPSHEDEAKHFGDASAADTLRRYRANGAGLVVVKDGPNDILAEGKAGAWRHSPPALSTVVDTTAAGDSFNAGFLAAYLTGAGEAAGLKAGCEVAGRVISARGALVS